MNHEPSHHDPDSDSDSAAEIARRLRDLAPDLGTRSDAALEADLDQMRGEAGSLGEADVARILLKAGVDFGGTASGNVAIDPAPEEKAAPSGADDRQAAEVPSPPLAIRLFKLAAAAAIFIGLFLGIAIWQTRSVAPPAVAAPEAPAFPEQSPEPDPADAGDPWLADAPEPPPRLGEPGSVAQTGAGERLRLALADGSILYLNQNTTAAVESPRSVRVARGEVFVDVAPDPEHPFVLHLPDRDATALGTMFGALVEPMPGKQTVHPSAINHRLPTDPIPPEPPSRRVANLPSWEGSGVGQRAADDPAGKDLAPEQSTPNGLARSQPTPKSPPRRGLAARRQSKSEP
ncbi:MAG: FecR family protein [Verrucomicrobiales bacterium]